MTTRGECKTAPKATLGVLHDHTINQCTVHGYDDQNTWNMIAIGDTYLKTKPTIKVKRNYKLLQINQRSSLSFAPNNNNNAINKSNYLGDRIATSQSSAADQEMVPILPRHNNITI